MQSRMKQHQTTDIILTDASNRRRQVEAPADFNWLKYPETLVFEGRAWRYVGAAAATPYYHESGAQTPLDIPQEKS